MVATVNDLVAFGLTRREPDPADRRRNVITMTKRGVTTLEHLDTVLDDVQDAVLAPLTAKERRTFVGLLAKLAPLRARRWGALDVDGGRCWSVGCRVPAAMRLSVVDERAAAIADATQPARRISARVGHALQSAVVGRPIGSDDT